MTPIEAQQALRDFAVTRDHKVFARLVQAHINLVYAAAQRQVRDPGAADDVTQAVFILLAKKAPQLAHSTLLSSWLLRSARHCAADANRQRARRDRHEQEAAAMRSSMTSVEADYSELLQQIDVALATLGPRDRAAIVMRYLEQRPLREIAMALGVAEEAAKKRIARGMERLRSRLGPLRNAVMVAAVAAALEQTASITAPPALAGAITDAAVAASSAAASGIGGAAVHLLAFWKIGIATVAAVLLFAGVVLLLPSPPAPISFGAAPVPATAPIDPRDWRTAFNNAYALQPNQNLRFIPPPPLPERQKYLHEVDHNDTPMPFIQWRWIDGKIKRQWMESNGPDGAGVASVLSTCAKLDGHHMSLTNLPHLNLDGDWVVRDGATTEAIVADLHSILLEQFKTDLRFEKTEVTKDALIATGNYHLKRIAGTNSGLQIYADVLDHPKPGDEVMGGGSSAPAELWSLIGGYLGIPIVDETKREPKEIDWLLSRSIANAADQPTRRQQILDNITTQTGVTFKAEKRTFTTWTVSEASSKDLPATAPGGL